MYNDTDALVQLVVQFSVDFDLVQLQLRVSSIVQEQSIVEDFVPTGKAGTLIFISQPLPPKSIIGVMTRKFPLYTASFLYPSHHSTVVSWGHPPENTRGIGNPQKWLCKTVLLVESDIFAIPFQWWN